MMRTKSLRIGLGLFVSIACLSPITSIARATSSDEEVQQTLRQQATLSSQEIATTNVVEPVSVDFTNCDTGELPFLVGTVKDASGQAVAGAAVSARVLGISSPTNPVDKGILNIRSTGPDGVFNLCHNRGSHNNWLGVNNNGDANGLYAVVVLASPNPALSGTSVGSKIDLLAPIPDISSPNGTSGCLNLSTTPEVSCSLNIVLDTPTISGTITNPQNSPIANARASLEFKYLGQVWTQLGEITANSSGFFGLSGFRQPNSFRVKVQRPWCELGEIEIENGVTCPYQSLGSINDGIEVSQTGGSYESKWSSNNQSTRTFQLQPANFSGRLKNGLGAVLAAFTDIIATNGVETINETTDYKGLFYLTIPDGTWSVLFDAPTYAIGVDTTYEVTVQNGSVVSVKRASDVLCSLSTTSCLTSFDLSLGEPNFIAVVRDTNGEPIRNAYVSVEEYVVSDGDYGDFDGNSFYVGSGDPDSQMYPVPAGLVGFNLKANSIYNVDISPPSINSRDLAPLRMTIKTGNSADNISVKRCATFSYWNTGNGICTNGFFSAELSDASNDLGKTDNRFNLEVPFANFKGVVCAPTATCAPMARVPLEISKFDETDNQWASTDYLDSAGDGTFSVLISDEGKYRLNLGLPDSGGGEEGASTNDLLASTNIVFFAEESSSGMKFFAADSSGTKTSNELPSVPIQGRGERTVVRFELPSLVLLSRTADGLINRNGYVSIYRASNTPGCGTCGERIANGSINQDGLFGVNLPVGTHVISVEPNWELENQNYVSSEYRITALDCNGDSKTEPYPVGSQCEDNPTQLQLINGHLVILLPGANFVGTLRRPDGNREPISYASVSVERWATCAICGPQTEGLWESTNQYDSVNDDGTFGLNFSEAGRFRLTFRPYSNVLDYSQSRMIVDVTVDGTVVVTPVVDNRVWEADGDGGFNVYLLLPNVSGTVTMPNGSPAQRVSINAEKWNSAGCGGGGCYTWGSESSGFLATGSDGRFATNLSQGKWRITWHPPFNTTGVSRTVRELVVTSDLDVCLLADSTSNGTSCPEAKRILSGEFDIQLPLPNFSGKVKNPDGSVSPQSSIQFQTWNALSNSWQFVNEFGNTNRQGVFGVNLTVDGSYRVSFEPSATSTGIAALIIYIRVCDSGDVVEPVATEELAKTSTLCSGNSRLDDSSLEYELLSSNFRGRIFDISSGSRVGLMNTWVGINRCGTGRSNYYLDSCRWEKGINTKSSGGVNGFFDHNLINVSDQHVTKYQIDVSPPWNASTALVRRQFVVWVRDFDENPDNGDEWCLDNDYQDGDLTDTTAGTCGDLNQHAHGSGYQWEIELSAGNLAGKVLQPVGATVVPNGWIQVEKWGVFPWNESQYGWQWTQISASANQSGAFGLQIDDAGLYRLTVNPGWDNSSGFTRSRVIIRVRAGGDWCQLNTSAVFSTNTATPDSQLPCTYGRDNDPSDLVTGLGLRLASANLRGVLYSSIANLNDQSDLSNESLKVGEASVSLQKKKQESWGTYWESLAWTNSSRSNSGKGLFAFRVEEDGEYRLDVQPSWQNSGDQAQFYAEFSASNCAMTCQFSTTSQNLQATIDGFNAKYSAPNFRGTVFGKRTSGVRSDTRIAGSWISVFNLTTSQWVGGVSTSWNTASAGNFALKLDDGTYRIEVWPRWDDSSNGIRRTLNVTVTGGSVVSCGSGCTPNSENYDIELMGETLSGKVYFPGTTESSSDVYASTQDGNQTAMPWAWASVYLCADQEGDNCDSNGGQWLDSQSSNQVGDLKFALEGRTNPYLVVISPNWSYYAASPLRLLVKIDPTDSSVTWKYESDSDSDYSSSAFTPDFGYVPPNVSVEVEGATSTRFVDLYRCDNGTGEQCSNGTWMLQATTPSSLVGATWKANFSVTTSGSYRVIAIRKSGDQGTLTSATNYFTYSSGEVTTSVSVSGN